MQKAHLTSPGPHPNVGSLAVTFISAPTLWCVESSPYKSWGRLAEVDGGSQAATDTATQHCRDGTTFRHSIRRGSALGISRQHCE